MNYTLTAVVLQSDQEIGSLSGGEALKFSSSTEFAKPFEILFLDEPSNDLDIENGWFG